MAQKSLGTHYIVELMGCPFELLDDEAFIRDALERAALEAEATLLGVSSHKFSPQGVTAVALLAESHLSIHTWPELGYAGVDIFTCGDEAKPRIACEFLVRHMRAQSDRTQVLPRGVGMECVVDETAQASREAGRWQEHMFSRTSG